MYVNAENPSGSPENGVVVPQTVQGRQFVEQQRLNYATTFHWSSEQKSSEKLIAVLTTNALTSSIHRALYSKSPPDVADEAIRTTRKNCSPLNNSPLAQIYL